MKGGVITWLEIADVFQAAFGQVCCGRFRRQRVAWPSVSPMKRSDVIRLAIVGYRHVRVLSGFLLGVVPAGVLRTIVDVLVRAKAREDRHDPAADFIQHHLEGFVSERKGVAVGPVVLGTIKIVGANRTPPTESLGLLPAGNRVDRVVTGRTRSFDTGVFESGLLVTLADVNVLVLMLTCRRRFIEHHVARR
jgi:uncharacterized membrane protein